MNLLYYMLSQRTSSLKKKPSFPVTFQTRRTGPFDEPQLTVLGGFPLSVSIKYGNDQVTIGAIHELGCKTKTHVYDSFLCENYDSSGFLSLG